MRLARSAFALAVVSVTAALGLQLGGCATPEGTPAPPAVETVAEPVGETSAALVPAAPTTVHLGHVLGTNAPLFPGDPAFSSTLFNTIPADGYKLELISMGTHTGTHVSAPCHFITGAKCIDELPASAFVLTSFVIDVRERIKCDPAHADFKLTVADIKAAEIANGHKIPDHALVIIHTGFSKKWGKPGYFDNAPGFSTAAVEWMVANRGIASLGSDTFGPDASTDGNYEGSSAIYAAGGTTFENMAGVEQLHAWGDTVIATPARLKNGSGFPTSPVAILR
jgi:kynurenine formamidase